MQNSYSLMFAYTVIPGCQPGLKVVLYSQWKLSGCTIYGVHLVACLQAFDIYHLLALILSSMQGSYITTLALHSEQQLPGCQLASL